MVDADMPLIEEIRAHLQSSAPHIRERRASVLLERAVAALQAAQKLHGHCNHSRPVPAARSQVLADMAQFLAAMEGKDE